MFSELASRVILGLLDIGCRNLLRIRRNINPATLSLSDNSHEHGAHASSLGFFLDVLKVNRRPAVDARRALAVDGPLARRLAGRHLEAHLAALAERLHVPLLALLLGKVERAHEDRLVAAGGVGAPHRARPQPRDHGGLAAALLGRQLHLGVEAPDPAGGLVLHPVAVVLHVAGQAVVALPALHALAPARVGVHGGPARKQRRYLDHGLVDGHGNRVQVLRVGLKSQPLRLQRYGAAARERVQERRQVVSHALADLGLGGGQHALVVGVLPHHQILQDAEEPLALGGLLLLGGELLRVRRRVVHQGGPDHRAGGRQGAPRPPQVKCRWVPVADGLLSRRRRVYRVEGQSHLDELLHCHVCSFSNITVPACLRRAMS